MSLSVITQKDLTSTIGYAEEVTEGTCPTDVQVTTQTWIGPIIRFSPTHGRSKFMSPQSGAEDLRETKYPGAKIGATTIVFKLVNDNMIKYFSSLEGGTGTVEKSISMMTTLNIHGTTKYWLAEFARPGFGLISSGRDQEVVGLVTMNHKYTLPLLTAWTSKPAFYTDPGESSLPTWLFSDGGNNPVTWDGDPLDCEAIRIMFDRMPIVRTSAGGSDLKINVCGGRRIRFRLTIGNDSYGQNLLDDYTNGTAKQLFWRVHPGKELIIKDCILDPIPEEWLTPEEASEVQLNLSGEGVLMNWSQANTLSSTFTIA